MRFLFVTYCFGNHEGQTLIGVYKRGLRVGMVLCERGHDVVFFCTGREGYADELTRRAEEYMRFVDIPFTVAEFEEAEENRRRFLDAIAAIAPDVVVIGEAPLAGALLEATLCSVELGIPVVFLDNAYNELFVQDFCEVLGPMADGVVLTGPSAHHAQLAPPYLKQVPPFIERAPDLARELLQQVGFSGSRMATILAYDQKVESLGVSLLSQLDDLELEILFCAREPEACRQKLHVLPAAATMKAAVIPQPTEEILFGLLEISRLAVVKYGFMQVSECLALRTPVIVVYHEGPMWLEALPPVSRAFTFVTHGNEAEGTTMEMLRYFVEMDPSEVAVVHNGEAGAAEKTAAFLEQIPHRPRDGTSMEAARLAFTESRLAAALSALYPKAAPLPKRWRSARLRVTDNSELHMLLVSFELDGAPRWERLWAHKYHEGQSAIEQIDELPEKLRRQILYYDESANMVIEQAVGEALLPELNP